MSAEGASHKLSYIYSIFYITELFMRKNKGKRNRIYGMVQKYRKMGYKTAEIMPAVKHCKHNTSDRIKLEI